MVRKGNHPAGRKICKFQICEIFLKYLDSIQQLWRWWWRQGAECVRLIIGGPYGARGVAVGAYPPEQSVIPCLELSKFLPRTPGLLFFSSEHAAMKQIQDNLMFGGFWPKMLKILPRQIGWVFNSVALVYFWLCLIMAAMADSRPQATKTPFPIFPPKNVPSVKKSKKRI